jgi:hypothetical protein
MRMTWPSRQTYGGLIALLCFLAAVVTMCAGMYSLMYSENPQQCLIRALMAAVVSLGLLAVSRDLLGLTRSPVALAPLPEPALEPEPTCRRLTPAEAERYAHIREQIAAETQARAHERPRLAVLYTHVADGELLTVAGCQTLGLVRDETEPNPDVYVHPAVPELRVVFFPSPGNRAAIYLRPPGMAMCAAVPLPFPYPTLGVLACQLCAYRGYTQNGTVIYGARAADPLSSPDGPG